MRSSARPPVQQRCSGRDECGRFAFTLFELLLVLTILVTLAALSWPRLTGVLKRQGVQGTAEQVRQLLDQARVRAVDEGRTLQVRFEPEGRRYVMLPLDPFDPIQQAAESTTASDANPPPFRRPFRVYQISEGCRFYVRRGLEQLHQQQEVFEKLDDSWLGHLENGPLARDAVWTAPILFYPDGSATDGAAIIVDQDRRTIELSVRGLTGTVYAAPLTQLQEIGGGKSN